MPTVPQPPRRRRFLWLRILFFLLSLPFVWWAVTRTGSGAAGYAKPQAS